MTRWTRLCWCQKAPVDWTILNGDATNGYDNKVDSYYCTDCMIDWWEDHGLTSHLASEIVPFDERLQRTLI